MLLAIVVTCVAGVFGLRAVRGGPRPVVLANAAVGLGVAGFATALIGPMMSDVGQRPVQVLFGVVTALLGVSAVGVAVWALRARRGAGGGRVIAPVAGLVCGLTNLAFGAAAAVMGSGVVLPADGTPWVWNAADLGFEVTVPTEQWAVKPNPNVIAQFACGRPPLAALVATTKPAGTDAEYAAVLAYGQKIKDDSALTNATESTGPNPAGLPHWVCTGDGTRCNGRYFFGVSITRVWGVAVVMFFEGPYRMASEAARNQEAHALRTQAGLFLSSVR